MIKKYIFLTCIFILNTYALEVGISTTQVNKHTDLWDNPDNCVNRSSLDQTFTDNNLSESIIEIDNHDYLKYEFFTDFALNKAETKHNFILQKIKKTTLSFNQERKLIQETTYLTEAFRLTDECGEKQTYKLDHHWGEFFFSDHLRIIIKTVTTGFGINSSNCSTESPWSRCYPQNNISWGGEYLKDPSLYNKMKIKDPVTWVFIFFLNNSNGQMKVDKQIYFKKK